METKPIGIRGVSEPISIQEMVERLLFNAALNTQNLAARYNIPLGSLLTVGRVTNSNGVVLGPSEIDGTLIKTSHRIIDDYLKKNPEALIGDFGFDYKVFDMRYDPPKEVDKRIPRDTVAFVPLEVLREEEKIEVSVSNIPIELFERSCMLK